jgi:NADH-quinone oxidoreductase subunit G
VVRHLARDNLEVNDAWLCDKGRYAFRFPDRDRVTTPLMRVPGLQPVSFREALTSIAKRAGEGRGVGFVAGGRLTDEDAYALSRLARTAFGTNDLDHRMTGTADLPIEVEGAAAVGMPATYRDVERASTIVVVGLDPREELPILHLRIRKAARDHGARVFVIHPRRTALDLAEHVPCPPGGEAEVLDAILSASGGEEPPARIAGALREGGEAGVILAGPRLGDSTGALSLAVTVSDSFGARFALLSRRAGDRGALRAGVHPALLPGGRRVEAADERGEVEAAWGGRVPDRRGRDARAILEAAAARELEVLYLVGADPLTDFPDLALARRAIENVPMLVVQDLTARGFERWADVVLPAAAFLEKDGHFTDWEGRGQRVRPVRDPAGLARPDWQIFQELSEVAGANLGFGSLQTLQEELGGLLAGRAVPLSPGHSMRGRPESPGDGLVLFTYPLLVDEGRQSVGADELKAALGQEPFLEVHPDDAARLGLEDGARARIRTEAGRAELEVRVTDGIHAGAGFVPWNQPGLAANTLLSGRQRIVAAVEPAEEKVEEAS